MNIMIINMIGTVELEDGIITEFFSISHLIWYLFIKFIMQI